MGGAGGAGIPTSQGMCSKFSLSVTTPPFFSPCLPPPLQSLNNLGVVYTSQGHAQEALTLLTAAIQACPTYSEAYNNLGVLQRDVGAIREAIQSYSKCLELAPDSRNAGQNRLLALNYIYSGVKGCVGGMVVSKVRWKRGWKLLPPCPTRPAPPRPNQSCPALPCPTHPSACANAHPALPFMAAR